MRGTIDFDKDRYPYAVQARGHGWKVHFVPSQELTLDVDVPVLVGERIAAAINAEHYAGSLGPVHETAPKIAATVIERMYKDGDIAATVYTQLKGKFN